MPTDALLAHETSMQAVQELTATTVLATWGSMGPNFDESWAPIRPQIITTVVAAQGAGARLGALSVPASLAEQYGVDAHAAGQVLTRAFAGTASDGRDLGTLLDGGVIRAKQAVSLGMSPDEALGVGERWLQSTANTQVADAARGAANVAITARGLVGYVRTVGPACCTRCAVLAGKFYKHDAGFLRHKSCLCSCEPVYADAVNKGAPDTPQSLFAEGRVTGLHKAQQRAIAEGADPIAVINADRGRNVKGWADKGMFTSEATTKRSAISATRRDAGLSPYGRQQRRPTVEGIYRVAPDREGALSLLREHGYLS